jgi:Cu(I)/Ag(I) efflux system membrane fusion protein
MSGINDGDEIVTNGAFTVDASAQLEGKLSMMNQDVATSAHEGHDMPATDIVSASKTTDPAFKAQLTKVYSDYLDLKSAFVATDAKKVTKEAKDVIASLKSVDMGLLKGDAHNMWMNQLKTLNSTINAISKSNDIEKQRQEFVQFNNAFYKSVKMFGLVNTTTYYQFCPMANNDKGAYWLSDSEEILNPYFGDVMLNCGEVKETIK